MLSKRVLDALREQFHEEFGELSERDSYIKRMKADAFALIGSMTPNDRRLRCEVDDAINDMERQISDSKLPEQILNAFQELNEYFCFYPRYRA